MTDGKDSFQNFEPQQSELIEALKMRNAESARLYIGALITFNTAYNPDRIALAGHGIRELMNKLPRFFAVPIVKEDSRRENDYIQPVRDAWLALEKKGFSPGTTPMTPPVERSLTTLLDTVKALAEAKDRISRGRKQQAANLAKQHNFHQYNLPKVIEENKVEQWNSLRDYFTFVSHHSSTTEAEFKSELSRFEQMLLDYIKPKTDEKNETILALIRKGNQNA